MWRSLFVALGIMALIFGIECLMIDSAILYSGKETTAVDFFDPTSRPADMTKSWQPSEWMPWAILSLGAVVVLYAFTIPRRFNNTAVGA